MSTNDQPSLADATVDPAPTGMLSHRRIVQILLGLMLGMFLAALDQTIVGPVLPKIVGELKGQDYYTWVVTIYLLTSTVTVPSARGTVKSG